MRCWRVPSGLRACGDSEEAVVRKQIVIIGGGTGGTMVANRLRRQFDEDDADIHVVDRDDRHVYQPGLLFVPFGLATIEEIVRPRHRQLRKGIQFHEDEVESRARRPRGSRAREAGSCSRTTCSSSRAARGSSRGDGRADRSRLERARVHVLHRRRCRGAARAARAVRRRPARRQPRRHARSSARSAPLEFAFLADWYFRERGIRDRVELAYVTPLDGAFTKPVASDRLGSLLAAKEIELITEFNAGEVDGVNGVLHSYDGRRPPSTCSSPCRSTVAPRSSSARRRWATRADSSRPTSTPSGIETATTIFALGDATNLPISKAGSVTQLRSRGADRERRARPLRGEKLERGYDGHAELLHRDRLPQGAAARLQLRDRAAARALPAPRPARCRCCASRG